MTAIAADLHSFKPGGCFTALGNHFAVFHTYSAGIYEADGALPVLNESAN
ncbi:MAG: hypothetical protein QOD99_1986 [Chthoniobacter sp.]|jgi:hypothetical protein|nr:hypothetical protein [Chthoniobacter sp.]